MKTIISNPSANANLKSTFAFQIIGILLTFIFCFKAGAHKPLNSDSLLCLEISGKLLKLKAMENDFYHVQLIHNGSVIDSFNVKDKKEFRFKLKKNYVYGIKITKPGYVDRLISIDTKLPQYANRFFRFEFDTELIEKDLSKKLNSDALDFPIAVISFNDEMKCFYFDEEYTTNIKRSLYLGEEF